MKKSIIVWKVVKLTLATSVVFTVAYFSLKDRVEQEHGPGSWDHWIRATPEVEKYAASSSDDLKPRNLKARFWTGVPRSRDSSVVRIDRSGHSVGLSKSTGRPVWLATYVSGQTSGESNNSVLRKWQPEPSSAIGPASLKSPPRGEEWVHYLPPSMMKEYYGHDADVWVGGNRFSIPRHASSEAWTRCMRLVDKYARLYSGLVVFIVPIYGHPSSQSPDKIAVMMVRPSGQGPSAMCISVDPLDESQGNVSWGIQDINSLEKETGVFFFADLPQEWRSFLLHPSQGKGWPSPD